ncbi:hypothetical protein JCM3770_002059 [Rhodotorula araucariae]
MGLSRLECLPSHLLLRILGLVPLQDLLLAVRPASRTLFLHAMSIARAHVLPLWTDEVRSAARTRRGPAPSTDPLGAGACLSAGGDTLPRYAARDSAATSPLGLRTRELALLDQFAVSLAHSLAQLGTSSLLFTSGDDALRLLPREQRAALCGWMQLRARCEDLLVEELQRHPGASLHQVDGADVRVELTRQQARVLLPVWSVSGGTRVTWRGVVSLARDAEESLEALAGRLARELQREGLRRRTGAALLSSVPSRHIFHQYLPLFQQPAVNVSSSEELLEFAATDKLLDILIRELQQNRSNPEVRGMPSGWAQILGDYLRQKVAEESS